MRCIFLLILAATYGCSFDPDESPQVSDAASDVALVDSARDMTIEADGARDAAVADTATDAWLPPRDLGTVDLGPADIAVGPATTVEDGALVLRTALPHLATDCVGSGGLSCEDADADGLVDAWEDLVLDRFRPLLRFDEQEQLFDDPSSVLLHVGRVAPTRRADRIQVWITILYDRDYGSCGSLSSHPGDSERVALVVIPGSGTVRMERAYTAAHENTPNDHSETYAGSDLLQLEYDIEPTGDARWVVYPSKNKHATYITRDVCENVSPIPCFSEACGPDGVDVSDFTRLVDIHNAGEPDTPLLDELGPLGFDGESIWADQPFCGGHERNFSCPGSVREKLITNPFQ